MAQKNKGFQSLARTLDGRMKEVSTPDTVLDFGEITGSYDLLTNTFPVPIPNDDYQVCRHLTIGNTGDILCEASGGNKVPVPEKMRNLKPGDRVLVAWVREEPVVIDIVLRADKA